MDNVLFASYYWHLNTSPDELRQRTWPQLNKLSFRVSVFALKEILRCDFHTVEYVLLN